MSRGNRPPPPGRGCGSSGGAAAAGLAAAPVGSSVRARLRPSVCVRMCKGSAAQARPLPPPLPPTSFPAASASRRHHGEVELRLLIRSPAQPGRDERVSAAGQSRQPIAPRTARLRAAGTAPSPRAGGEGGGCPPHPPTSPHPGTPHPRRPLRSRVGRVSPFAPLPGLLFIHFSSFIFTPGASQSRCTGEGGSAGGARRCAKGKAPPWEGAHRGGCAHPSSDPPN